MAQNAAPAAAQTAQTAKHPVDIKDEIRELSMDFNDMDENLAVEKLKNWIETN